MNALLLTDLEKKLSGALIGLAKASESKELSKSAGDALIKGLIMSAEITPLPDYKYTRKEDIKQDSILEIIDWLHKEKANMAPDCAACQYPCGRTADYDMEELYHSSEVLRNAKLKLFSQLKQIASHPHLQEQPEVRHFLSESLFLISCTYDISQLEDSFKRADSYLLKL